MLYEVITPPSGGGIKRWHKLARILGDCRAVLISGIGDTPLDILMKSGVEPIEAAGFIEEALATVYEGGHTVITSYSIHYTKLYDLS